MELSKNRKESACSEEGVWQFKIVCACPSPYGKSENRMNWLFQWCSKIRLSSVVCDAQNFRYLMSSHGVFEVKTRVKTASINETSWLSNWAKKSILSLSFLICYFYGYTTHALPCSANLSIRKVMKHFTKKLIGWIYYYLINDLGVMLCDVNFSSRLTNSIEKGCVLSPVLLVLFNVPSVIIWASYFCF